MPTQNNRHTISDLYQMQSLPLEIKVRMTQRRIRDWVEYWGEDGVYVSFSGGKDSTVLLDICRRMYPNIVAVYSDTGLEFPEIREFVKTKDNVVWVKPELTFRKVIEKCGYPCISKEQAEWIHRIRLGQKNTRDIQKYFYGIRTNGQPSRFKISERWKFMLNAPFDIGAGCCNEMKKKPIAKYAKESGRVPIVGTMACESSLRTSNWLRYGCNAYDNKKATSAPLSFWTDADIWEYIRTYDIPYAFGAAEEQAFCVGTGTGQPTGLFTANGGTVGVTAASATAVTTDEVISLIYALKAPYRKNAKFLMNDATVSALRKLKDSNGQYLWQPSLQAGQPDRLLGYEIYTSPYAPTLAAGALSIAFGDFQSYWIADRTGRTVQRLNELYSTNGQVGFVATERVDGKIILPEGIQLLKMKAS